jgi:GDP/GTP exchange factor required for growth at low temperature
MISHFNKTASWVASEIILTANPKQRILVLERFIELAEDFKILQNYHGMMEVYSALNMAAIQRIKPMWKVGST